MRNDLVKSYEELERVCEDYFFLLPPDMDMLHIEELVDDWEFDEFENTLTFKFRDVWDLDTFMDYVEESPKYEESFAIGDMHEGVNREKLTVIIEGKEKGLM